MIDLIELCVCVVRIEFVVCFDLDLFFGELLLNLWL